MFPPSSTSGATGGSCPLIAEPLAKLAVSGQHETGDPAQAAEHLPALTFGQVDNKSVMGTIQLSDSEADRIITSGIAVFMRGYAPTPAPDARGPAVASSKACVTGGARERNPRRQLVIVCIYPRKLGGRYTR